MVTPVKLIDGVTLPNAAAAQYTGPARVATIIKKFTVANTDAGAGHTLTVYVCASGAGPGVNNIVIDARVIGPLQSADITELINQMISGGGTLQAFSDDGVHINAVATGVQIA